MVKITKKQAKNQMEWIMAITKRMTAAQFKDGHWGEAFERMRKIVDGETGETKKKTGK